MPKPLDPAVGAVLKQYGFGREAIWDCHGTWVVYHKALEQIAAKAGIEFDLPLALETNGTDKCVALCVAGKCGNRTEWSIGEAAPGNNKNAYPYAMAEKRAKDRVILKLIGLHGLVYSEEEADDFRESRPSNGRGPDWGKSSQAKKRGDWDALQQDLMDVQSVVGLAALQTEYEERVYPNWNRDWREQAHEAFEKRRQELEQASAPRTVPASKQGQGRQERKPGPRLSGDDATRVKTMLAAQMKQKMTKSDLDAWADDSQMQKNVESLPDDLYYTFREEFKAYRASLAESTLEAG